MKAHRCSGKDGCGSRNVLQNKPMWDDCNQFFIPKFFVICDCGRGGEAEPSMFAPVALWRWNSNNDGWVDCERALPPEMISRKLVVVEAYNPIFEKSVILRGWGYYKHKHIDERSSPEKNAWHIHLETGQDVIIKKGGNSEYKVVRWMDEPELPTTCLSGSDVSFDEVEESGE